MWSAERIVQALRAKGEVWEPEPGLVGLRGDALMLATALEGRFNEIAHEAGCELWRLPPGLSTQTLTRADYFAAFPHWLTVVGHLSDDPSALEAVARASDPPAAAAAATRSSGIALPAALCYHTYEALASSTVTSLRMTAHGTCWRREGEGTRTLERGWAFTMTELVHVGSQAEVEEFRCWGAERASRLATSLGLCHDVASATDPFYAPTARGRMLLQQVKGLKTELLIELGDGRTVAAASFNDHERFFGERFDIRLANGEPASSGCIAFGLERWVLGFMVAHGPDRAEWPEHTLDDLQEGGIA